MLRGVDEDLVRLGLAIAGQCAEAHGGGITVESHPGTGSTFVVSLPLAETEDEPGDIKAMGHRPA